jgi:transcriptional regulator with XRE-family HTH domain
MPLPGRTAGTGINPRAVLGRRLAALRREAGYTQAGLARLTAYTRSSIAGAETGRQRVPRAFWAGADAALSAGGELLGAYDQIRAAEDATGGGGTRGAEGR